MMENGKNKGNGNVLVVIDSFSEFGVPLRSEAAQFTAIELSKNIHKSNRKPRLYENDDGKEIV